MKKLKVYLTTSVIFNILLFTYVIRLVNGLGGVTYITNKIHSIVPESPYQILYKNKVSIFSNIPHIDNETLFIGDSLTDYGQWESLFENKNIVNLGIAGDRIDGVISRILPEISHKPSKIFLMIGINNIRANEKVTQILNKYEILIKMIRIGSPQTRLYIQTILPTYGFNAITNQNIIEINKKLKIYAAKYNCTYVDIYDSLIDKNSQLIYNYSFDGTHLNGEGYQVWQSRIEDLVNE